MVKEALRLLWGGSFLFLFQYFIPYHNSDCVLSGKCAARPHPDCLSGACSLFWFVVSRSPLNTQSIYRSRSNPEFFAITVSLYIVAVLLISILFFFTSLFRAPSPSLLPCRLPLLWAYESIGQGTCVFKCNLTMKVNLNIHQAYYICLGFVYIK